MRDHKSLQTYWQKHNAEELILCTIVGKTGSGYRSTGAKKLIRQNGESCGYLSGGCLEGDIIETGIKRWNEAPFTHSFSTMSEEDRLMGYQTGCAGVIDVLFERVPANTRKIEDYLPYGPAGEITSISISLAPETLGQRTPLKAGDAPPAQSFIDRWEEPVSLYVIGCGPNTRIFAELAPALGWHVTFLDYRKGNVIDETQNVTSRIVALEEMGAAIPAQGRTAVILSTHNYEADLNIMRQLNGRAFNYLGCIGPRKRFEQMQDDLRKFHETNLDKTWADKVHAPAGLYQGHAPENIALSIVAEIQQKLLAA